MGIKEFPDRTSLFWLLLIVTAGSYVIVRPPGFGSATNLSLFDPVMLIAGLVLLVRTRGRVLFTRTVFVATGLMAVLAFHAIAVSAAYDEIDLPGLMRETVKSSAVVYLFGVSFLIFQRFGGGYPNRAALRLALVLLSGIFAAISLAEPPFVPRTAMVFAVIGVLFLLVAGNEENRDHRFVIESAIQGVLCAGVSYLLFSKIGMAMSLTIGFWPLAHRGFRGLTRPVVVGAVLVGGAAVALAFLLGTLGSVEMRIDGFERSFGVRSELWSAALSGLMERGPLGIGAGQFAALAAENPVLGPENHRYVHSVPVWLIAEYGVAGLAMLAGLVWLIYRSGGAWSPEYRPLYFIVIGAPALLHDTHGIRMMILLVAFSLARARMQRSSEA